MSSRLLIWGYGRVGSAIASQCMARWSTNIGQSNGFDEFWVLSEKPRPTQLDPSVKWASGNQILSNPSENLTPGDVVLLTVSDSAIAALAAQCDVAGVTVVHCSGATPRISLEKAASMVFYPLQTFTADSQIDWSQVPVFTESSADVDPGVLKNIAGLLGVERWMEISFSARQNLHMAAVFANNFTTAMAGIAHDILKAEGLEEDWIRPILAKTAENLGASDPWMKLTGPAKRGDLQTQQNHLDLLLNHPQLKDIYTVMSGYIHHRTNDNDADAPNMD